MSGDYEVIVDDGMGNVIKVTMNRNELCQFIGGAIWSGVLASAKIEGESVDDIEMLPLTFNLPEELLTTPKTF